MLTISFIILVAVSSPGWDTELGIESFPQQSQIVFFDSGYVDLLNTIKQDDFPLITNLTTADARGIVMHQSVEQVIRCHSLAVQHVRAERSHISDWCLSGLGSRSGELPTECRVAYNAITNPREPGGLVPGTLELLVSALRTFGEDYYIQELARSSEGWWDNNVRLVYLAMAMRTIVRFFEPTGPIHVTADEITERTERQDRERTNILRTLCEEEFAVGCFYFGALSSLPTSPRERIEALQKYLKLEDTNDQRKAIAEQRLSQLMEAL